MRPAGPGAVAASAIARATSSTYPFVARQCASRLGEGTTRRPSRISFHDRVEPPERVAGAVHHRQAEDRPGQVRVTEDRPLHGDLVVLVVQPTEDLLEHLDLCGRVGLEPRAEGRKTSVSGSGSSGPGSVPWSTPHAR